jgi:hypothetical protein
MISSFERKNLSYGLTFYLGDGLKSWIYDDNDE